MEPTDLTIEILKSIHSEIRATNARADGTNARLDDLAARVDGTNARLDEVAGRLERRQVETEIRLATEIVGVAGAVREIRDLLKDDLSMRREVRDLQQRVGALETRAT